MATISKRITRGYEIVSQIFALLSDLPVGNLRVQIGLALRHAWLINGILFNSEAWHSTTKEQVAQFVEIYKYLLRGLVGSHAKAPLHYADLGDIQQNIFCLIIKITFCYGFSSKFQECLLGVERRYRKKINPMALFVTKIEFFSPNLLAISFAPIACPYRRTLCKLMSKFFDQY